MTIWRKIEKGVHQLTKDIVTITKNGIIYFRQGSKFDAYPDLVDIFVEEDESGQVKKIKIAPGDSHRFSRRKPGGGGRTSSKFLWLKRPEKMYVRAIYEGDTIILDLEKPVE